MAAWAPGPQEQDTAAESGLDCLRAALASVPSHPNMPVADVPFARGPPWLGMEHAPWSGSWKRASTALAPRSGWGAVFTSMLRAVPASSLVSLFRAWTHRGDKGTAQNAI